MGPEEHLPNIEEITYGDVKGLLWRFTIQHGPWFALSTVLLAALFGWIGSPLRDQIETVRGAVLRDEQVILENRSTIIKMQDELEAQGEYQNVLLRAICHSIQALKEQGVCEPGIYYKKKSQ